MKIGILSRFKEGYSTRRLAEAARERGHTVWVMDPFDVYIHVGCKGSSIYYRSRSAEVLDVVIPRLSPVTARYGVEVLYQFEMAGVPLVNPAQAVVNARNKFRSLAILARKGIPVPPTFAAGSLRFLHRAVKRTGEYPFILKPFEGTQGRGIIVVDSPVELYTTLEAMWSLNQDYIVQPFYIEAAGRDIRALVIGGRVLCAMRRIAPEGEFRANIHRGGVGFPIELTREEERLAVRAARALNLNIAGVDILQTGQGPMVIEVNPSPGFEGLEKATGIDVAGAMIDFAVQFARKAKRQSPHLPN
ncbi:30S ribosomal protein S6--L-glutamate ligase [Candidatus Poribacteria bacterium]|nr:MAG: 30S ribosomal protein S6--L-glutamate ligase [Candidatus Poribacteria bacterium]